MASAVAPLHGLSRDVTLAVLPRLFTEELVAELARRDISFGGNSIRQEILVDLLKDLMTKEYRNLEIGKYSSHGVTKDRTSKVTPDTELVEREQFQCQELQKYSQTLSRICPSPNIENSSYTVTASTCHEESVTATNQENQANYEETHPDTNASGTSCVLSENIVEDHTEMGYPTEEMETTTTQPISQLDNVCSPYRKLEDGKNHVDESLCSVDSCCRFRNSRNNSNENNTSSNIMYYNCKDCEYETNDRSDFVKHTRTHNVSFASGLKREEQDYTSQSHLLGTEQGIETPEVTTMQDPSNTVIASQQMQADLPMTEPVPDNSERVRANCNDEKVTLCMDANGDSGLYDTQLDGNATHHNESDFRDLDYGKKSSSGNNPSTCLKAQDITLHTCKECDYQTKINRNFVRHTMIHTGEKPFMSMYCDYRTARLDSLKTHMYRHVGEKPFKCSECEFRTVHKSYLVEHIRKHTGEKPYKCDECGFKAAAKGHLVGHMRKHTGEKPFMCGKCGFQSAYKSSMDVHMLKHTGNRPYVCNLCGYSARQKAHLAAHQRKHDG